MSTKPHQLALGEGCQRWLHRRPRYRPPGEPFDPGRYEVALIDEGTAKPWVISHHYSGSYPAARLRVGLFFKERHRPEQLGVVAVFSVPMNQAVAPSNLGVPASASVELGRFVLQDHELLAANAETWFLARAFRFARHELSAAKWLAVILIIVDHWNKYLSDKAVPWMYAVGRISMPLFAFVLGYNLA